MSLVCLCFICLAFLRGGAEVKKKHKMEHRFERLPCAGRKAELENAGLKMDDHVYQHLIWLLWNEVEALDNRQCSGPLISCTLSPCSKRSGFVKNLSIVEEKETDSSFVPFPEMLQKLLLTRHSLFFQIQ